MYSNNAKGFEKYKEIKVWKKLGEMWGDKFLEICGNVEEKA